MATTRRWVPVCKASAVPEAAVVRVEIAEGRAIALYRVGGRFYATDDLCTHGAASLSEGFVDGDVIECPFHGGAFRIPTGEVVDPPCVIPLRTYPVKVVGDDVLAEVEDGL